MEHDPQVMENKSFTIYRDEWYRGKGSAASGLLVHETDDVEKQCCIGFYCEAIGTPRDRLRFKVAAEDLMNDGTLPAAGHWLIQRVTYRNSWGQSPLGKAMYKVNDDPTISETFRESILATLFEAQGCRVIFKDTRPKHVNTNDDYMLGDPHGDA